MGNADESNRALGSAILGIIVIGVSIMLGIGLVILGLGLWFLGLGGVSLVVLITGILLLLLGILAAAYSMAGYIGRLRG